MISTTEEKNLSDRNTASTNQISLPDSFADRHLGPRSDETRQMLNDIGLADLDKLMQETLPSSIRLKKPLELPMPISEFGALAELKAIASTNKVYQSFIGLGYSHCIVPPVIQRTILENPGWYTQYTPYQSEISQGRLEALLNFQTIIADLTGLDVSNASLLDEGTAAAEAMALCKPSAGSGSHVFWAANDCHPQTLAVLKTRSERFGWTLKTGHPDQLGEIKDVFGVLLQNPSTDGAVRDYSDIMSSLKQKKIPVVMAVDPLSLVLVKSPGEMGADIAVGSAQRFGVPLGFGGPHAGFIAASSSLIRRLPGRIVGISHDSTGKPGYRLTLQTREQHIRRERATSNICTAQVLLAILSSMYVVYHGPGGLRRIAGRVHQLATILANKLTAINFPPVYQHFFDTLRIDTDPRTIEMILDEARKVEINLRRIDKSSIGISLDETCGPEDLNKIVECFLRASGQFSSLDSGTQGQHSPPEGGALGQHSLPDDLLRSTDFLSHSVFNKYHSETEMLRYIRKLESRDLSLADSMIPLGSCTMKLNAASELIPISWPEFKDIHPFAPIEQTQGYHQLFKDLENWLMEITGFDAVSLQPNAGSQGEYAGLIAIRSHQESEGQANRNICLIPQSAHGTNPASAVMTGLKVITIKCDSDGNIDIEDLKVKADKHREQLSSLMVTYPSTHGVFEESIRDICDIIHKAGGMVYMDGANMNAQVGLCRPADIGADVCHLNLHKTFCIPHGGGGPGVGPIAVTQKLAPHLPGHPMVANAHGKFHDTIASAPWGSPGILPISWMYIRMMGNDGLTMASQIAILNANYMAEKLAPYYPILYRGKNNRVAHECIIDLRHFRKHGIEVEDVAKRLIDYGFHAPTISWPVTGTMMIEPTESESKAELDRYCEAMIAIRKEIDSIIDGKTDATNNLLKNAPHSAAMITNDSWDHPYTRNEAAFPAEWTQDHKFWPAVGRIDNVYGDRNPVCSCPVPEVENPGPEASE